MLTTLSSVNYSDEMVHMAYASGRVPFYNGPMTTQATPKQMNYLRSLVAASGQEIHEYLISHGICHQAGWREPYQVADMPSKAQASRLIDELKNGRQTAGHAPDIDIVNGY